MLATDVRRGPPDGKKREREKKRESFADPYQFPAAILSAIPFGRHGHGRSAAEAGPADLLLAKLLQKIITISIGRRSFCYSIGGTVLL